MKLYCITHEKFFNTITDAVNFPYWENLSASNIIRCCKGEIASTGKDSEGDRLQWCYAEDFLKHKDLPCIEADKKNWIICLTDGLLFHNSKEACNHYDIVPSRISMNLNGTKPTAGKHGFTGEVLKFKRFEEFRKEHTSNEE